MKACVGKLIALAPLCLFLIGCAQTGPPLPPSLELPKPPSDLRAIRKGNRVILNWSEPSLTTDRQSVRYLGPTLVCRSLEPDISACRKPVATIPPPAVVTQNPAAKRAHGHSAGTATVTSQDYVDTLPASLESEDPAAEITYAVEVLNRNARGDGSSNRVHVPAIVTLPAPSDVSAQLTDEGVTLNWTSAGEAVTPPGASSDSPRLQLRYRIYRRDESSGKDAIAGEIPVGKRGPVSFTDAGLEWEKTYFYRVTSVSVILRRDNEVQIEGDDSSPLHIVAHDIFPPAVPAGLQAVYSGEGQKPFIDLIWAPVSSADLSGYNVYRKEAGSGDDSGKPPVKLNSGLVKSPAYRDSEVISGRTYIYAVSSVDVRGNESRRSDETSESVP